MGQNETNQHHRIHDPFVLPDDLIMRAKVRRVQQALNVCVQKNWTKEFEWVIEQSETIRGEWLKTFMHLQTKVDSISVTLGSKLPQCHHEAVGWHGHAIPELFWVDFWHVRVCLSNFWHVHACSSDFCVNLCSCEIL